MTFIIPEEELTTEGPFSLGPVRPLSSLEVVYAEMILQMEIQAAWDDVMSQPEAEAPTSSAAMGVRSVPVGTVQLPDPVAAQTPANPVKLHAAAATTGPLPA